MAPILLGPAFVLRLKNAAGLVAEALRGAGPEELSGRVHRFARLEIGGEAIRNPEIIVAGLNLSDADLVLGIDIVRSWRIWLSYGAQKIFLLRRI